MKITFYPTKEAVLAKLGHQLKEAQKGLDEAKEHLATLEAKASETKLHNPYLDQERSTALSRVRAWEKEEEDIQDTVGLAESAKEGTFSAETEV